MKKTLSVAIILILLLAFPFSVLAKEELYQPAEDLQSVVCSDGSSYYPVNLEKSNYPDEYKDLTEKDVALNNTIWGKPTKISGEAYEGQHFISLRITFENGGIFSCDYMRKDYLDAYNTLANSPSDRMTIEFDFPAENSLEVSAALLKGKRCVLSKEELEWSEYFYCYATDQKVPLRVRKGALLVINDQFYFADLSEIPQEDPSWFSPFEYEQLDAYKITDSSLLSELKNSIARNKYGDLSIFENKDILEIIYWIILATLLFFLPLIGLIFCLIFTLRPAGNHRKAFLFGAIGLAAELIGFLIYFILKIL